MTINIDNWEADPRLNFLFYFHFRFKRNMLLQLLQILRNNNFTIDSLSISFHVAILFFITIFSLHKWFNSLSSTTNLSTSSKPSASNSHTNCYYYRLAFFTSLAFSLLSLTFCILNFLFCYYKYLYCLSSPSFQLDLAVRSLSWLALTVYLHFHSLTSTSSTVTVFPRLLTMFWVIFLIISSCLIAIDFITVQAVEIQYWLLHSASLLCACVLNVSSFFGRNRRNSGSSEDISEPLLNSSHVVVEESPFARAGFLSVLTFSWMGPLFVTGRQKTIGLQDIPQLGARDCAVVCFPIFKSKLNSTASSYTTATITNYKLVKALVISNWGQIAVTAVYALVYCVSTYVGPYLIDYLVQYLNGNVKFANEGYILVFAFIVAKLLECLSQRHWFFTVRQAGMRVRSSLITLIYQKGLTLSSRGRQSRTSGEIINLISVDAERIGLFGWFMHDVWLVPVQITLALLILYSTLGLASIAALVATFIVMLGTVPIQNMQKNYQEKLMECKDVRMKATSEILRNMRILKLQAWEMKFLSKILELRNNETNWLSKYLYTLAMVTFVFWAAPAFVAVVTFGACLLLGTPLEVGKILSALATFRVLQEPIYNLPDSIAMVIKTKISLDRISSFLGLEELQPDAVERLPNCSLNIAVEVSNGSFSWDIASQTPTLQDLNFQVLKCMKVAVCGSVGSGKSSLLSCMLGEVPKVSGTVKICERTAYVPQSAWIQSGKIQDNILFGNEMDIDKYDRILEACSLKKDLEILPFGDQTIIGERGINLSGGQKQRIQIARALYHDADVYLFDDPFSALDAHTGSYVFKECLLGFLASKTVIYVTHQVEFLPSADLILCMKDGRIVQEGKYSEMLNIGSEFMGLVDAHMDALAPLSSGEFATNTSYNNSKSSSDSTEGASQKAKKNEEQNGDSEATQKEQLVQEEEREKGKVGFSVYWGYMTMAYKGGLVPIILLAQILFQALQIGSNFWMTWAAPASADVEPPVSSSVLIYVFVAFAVGSALCVLVRSWLLMTAGYKTATIMFNKMHTSIFRAPMSFFDSTPSGRILNRASTDQDDVDTTIPFDIGHLAFTIIQLLGIIIVMSQVAWQVFVLFIPVMAVTIWYQQYYLDTARELSRLVGVCKAPLIQHFAESLEGSTIIRSFNKDSEFSNDNCHLMDHFTRPKFHYSGAREWLCLRLDMLSTLTFAFSLIFLISVPRGLIDPGIAGLVVTYGLNLNTVQSMVIWVLSCVENRIISVERILQYSSISSEPPLIVETKRPSRDWPLKGEVDIRNLQVRYAPHMPFVLKGLTCTFPGGVKTGIVGRTGSGKSTLIQTLFRIIDPTIGQIVVDGIDITTIGLHDLRLRLSIIPQDPTMFEGTVRSNLDPLEEYTDEQIWEALDCCQLGDEVRKKEKKLDSPVIENGENWSVGQRQLVCLGRVLLKKSKVLVLDEATASVDTATDGLIQKTLRQQFSESTVITIAHRITSVLDSDMVVLLDNGLIVEQDIPARLLENKASMFAQLVSEYTMRSSSSFDQLDGN